MKQTGTALITALFIMTLVVIAAVAMTLQLQTSLNMTELSLNYQQLYLATLGVNSWAKGILINDAAVLKLNPTMKDLTIDHLAKLCSRTLSKSGN